jgi:tetratricopeptide (TPR) repeat protein
MVSANIMCSVMRTLTASVVFASVVVAARQSAAEDAAAYIKQGQVWLNQGWYDKAIAIFTKAITADPKNALAYSYRGFAWGRKGEFNKAIADCDEAIKLNPTVQHTRLRLERQATARQGHCRLRSIDQARSQVLLALQ